MGSADKNRKKSKEKRCLYGIVKGQRRYCNSLLTQDFFLLRIASYCSALQTIHHIYRPTPQGRCEIENQSIPQDAGFIVLEKQSLEKSAERVDNQIRQFSQSEDRFVKNIVRWVLRKRNMT